MKDAKQIKEENLIQDYMEAEGYEIRGSGVELKCLCPFHEDRSPSFSINTEKRVWTCRAGCGGGSIIDLVSRLEGITVGDALRKLGGDEESIVDDKPIKKAVVKKAIEKEVTPVEVASYQYHNQMGDVVYEVVRFEPKNFKQCKIDEDGGRVWKMDGVERVLYNLPDVLKSESVVIVEGEKDVESLRKIGVVATCNPGGAKKWLPAYSQYLEGKAIFLIPDNDKPGHEHCEMVLKSLEGKVKSVNWMELPRESMGKPVKDITDFIQSFGEDKKKLLDEFMLLHKTSRYIAKGIDCGISSMVEMERSYIAEMHSSTGAGMDLREIFPELNVRPLVGGDLVGVLARTGQCKTLLIQNLCFLSPDYTKLIFELEVKKELLFERFAGMATRQSPDKIEQRYRGGVRAIWETERAMQSVYCCDRPEMTIHDVDEFIERSSAKIGHIPKVAMIDYIQLIKGSKNQSTYDRVSEAAERAKVIAKKWNMIVFIVSQSSRDKSMGNEVDINSGKESGSIEASVGLYLGIWKNNMQNGLTVKVLKNTKGMSGQEVDIELPESLRMRAI